MAIPFDYSAEYKRKLCTPDEKNGISQNNEI